MAKFRTKAEHDAINSKARVHRVSKYHSDMMDAYAKVSESIGFPYSRNKTVDLVEVDGVFTEPQSETDKCRVDSEYWRNKYFKESRHDDMITSSLFAMAAGYHLKPISNE